MDLFTVDIYNLNRYVYWLILVCHIVFIMALNTYLWLNQPQDQLDTAWEAILIGLKYTWFIPLVWASFNFLGLIRGYPLDVESSSDTDWRWDKQVLLIVSYVSKGDNKKALRRSLEETQKTLDSMNVRYEIEIVTDTRVPKKDRVPTTHGSVYYYSVPQRYETDTKVKYKARALQYCLQRRNARLSRVDEMNWQQSDVWVLHLDEESIMTSQAIIGIRGFINKYSLRRSDGAIGQGEILYNSYNYGKNILTTSMDSLRTGDDLGRFRFQYEVLNRPVAGMHGSFVLVPAVTEKAIGWDWGAKSVLAEDAYFALKAMEKDVKFDWVSGFIKEQSPFTVRDIIKQRMRWYTGLTAIARDRSLKLSTRTVLIFFTISWALAWIGSVAFILNFVVTLLTNKGFFPFWAVLITSWITGVIGSVYLIGVFRNITHCIAPFWRKLYIALTTYILWFFQILVLAEAAAVLYTFYRAIFRPLEGFPVVAKD